METPTSTNIHIPRLRLIRRSPSPRFQNGNMDRTPLAGSSSARLELPHNNSDDEDQESTPRMQTKAISPSTTHYGSGVSPLSATPTDTTASRLRAVLALTHSSPPAQTSLHGRATPSEIDSDIDTPHFDSKTSSIATESIRDLFSHALREPGGTPLKSRPRRNSVDVSDVETNATLKKERDSNKGNRLSLSDEEVDRPSTSDPSFRLSHAATFDTLNARLMSSQTQLMDQQTPSALFNAVDSTSSSLADKFTVESANADSKSSARFFGQSTSSPATPPVATSTPQHSFQNSFQMSSQLAYGSNLMDQDSEMQKVMKEFDVSEGEVSLLPKRISTPMHPSKTPLRPRSSASFHAKSGSRDSIHSNGVGENGHTLVSRRASGDFSASSSRASSSMSINDTKDPRHAVEEERNREREREWNRPHPKQPLSRSGTPELHHRHSHSHMKSLSQESFSRNGSPMTNGNGGSLHRRGSSASLRSLDDDKSSRPSSMGSHADYRERIAEMDQERNKEREREWNKRHPPNSRPSSSLSTHSATSQSHIHPHAPRPPSATPYLTPTHSSLQRQASHSSLSLSSRASSPSGSIGSRGSLKEHEPEEEFDHERERNWNSPHPKWHSTRSRRDSEGSAKPASPLPTGQVNGRLSENRGMRQSLRSTSSLSSVPTDVSHRKPTPSGSKVPSSDPHSTTKSFRSSIHNQHSSFSPRPPSPVHTEDDNQSDFTDASVKAPRMPALTSRFGWHFPRSHSSTSANEIEKSAEGPVGQMDSMHNLRQSTPSPSPSSRPSSRMSGVMKPSLIPVLSPSRKSKIGSNERNDGEDGEDATYRKGHRRTLTELSESAGRIPPHLRSDGLRRQDLTANVQFTVPSIQSSRVESDAETEVLESAPSSPKPHRLPSPSAALDDENRLQKALAPLVPSPPIKTRVPSPSSRSTTPPLPPQSPAPHSPPATKISLPFPTEPPPQLSRQIDTKDENAVQPLFSLSTPPRRSSLHKLEFRTPSPPHDLPELPGPPSSSEEETEQQPGQQHEYNGGTRVDTTFSAMQTPRPPGAWAATPVQPKYVPPASPSSPVQQRPTIASSSSLPKSQSLPDPSHGQDQQLAGNGPVTPLQSRSRAASLPLQTPAPPGAWLATPNQPTTQSSSLTQSQSQFGSLGRRRSILKVRFDVEPGESDTSFSMTEVTAPTIGKPAVESPQEAVIRPDQADDSTQNTTTTAANGSADSNADLRSQERSKTPSPVVPSTPIVPVPRPLRKSPSVRLVDAFGRERLEENSDADKDTNLQQESSKNGAKNRKETKDERESTTALPHVQATPRNNSRSAVRIVDAMGREVEENLDPSLKEREESGDVSVIDDIVMGRDEALAYVKATLREFQEVSSDAEKSGDETLHALHLQNLDGVSLTARGVRGQLTCDLRKVKDNEPDLSTKYASMRESRSKRIIQPTAVNERRLPIRTMIFVFVVFQIIIALWMFRFANREAHRLFYTDYYDPWYPELYDHYKYRSSAVFSSHPWSVAGFFEALKREGWGVVSRVVARAVGRSENEVWKTWGNVGHRELCPT